MSNKTILITGASSGIGKACAKLFQSQGWNIIATMRSPEKEEELIEFENVLIARLDVQDRDSITQAVKKGIERFGQIDLLLNNAGYGAYGVFESASYETIRRQFEVNVFGVLDVIQAVLPYMRSRKSGMIINISSMVGRFGFALGTLYHGSKFALEGISEAMSYELAAIGIQMKLIEPGAVKTNFANSLDFYYNKELKEYQSVLDAVSKYAEEARGRGIAPEEVSKVVYRAATDSKEQFRYPVGEDAVKLFELREKLGDKDFFKIMRERMGI